MGPWVLTAELKEPPHDCNTPPKTNMEPQNRFGRWFSFSNGWFFQVPAVSLPGCNMFRNINKIRIPPTHTPNAWQWYFDTLSRSMEGRTSTLSSQNHGSTCSGDHFGDELPSLLEEELTFKPRVLVGTSYHSFGINTSLPMILSWFTTCWMVFKKLVVLDLDERVVRSKELAKDRCTNIFTKK